MADAIAQCKFAGIIPIYLRTYTTTYAPLHNQWQWNEHSMQPMEFEGYFDAGAGNAVGFQARLIDAATGYTDINVGVVSAFHDPQDNYPGLCYEGNQILGWVMSGNTRTPSVSSYYAPLDGGTHTYPQLLTHGITLPLGVSNTFAPAPGGGCNYVTTGGGIYSSGIVSLNLHSYIWGGYGLGGGVVDNNNFGLAVPNTAFFRYSMPYNGVNYIYVVDTQIGVVPYNVVATNYVSFATTIGIAVQNPASSTIDLNALFQQHDNTGVASMTYAGWLGIYKDTQTFNGVTMVGYGILMSPDLTSYAILNFIPLDATALNWNMLIGEMSAKVDRSGAMWMKNASSDTVLFIGAQVIPGTVFPAPVYPTTPPVNLPVILGLNK